MPILKVHHRTTYRYSQPVAFGTHRWLFRPRDSQEQRLILAERQISPEPSEVSWLHDVFNNQIAIARFSDVRAKELTFESHITLEHTPHSGTRFPLDDSGQSWPFDYDPDLLIDLAGYRAVHYPDPAVAEWARSIVPDSGTTDTAELLLRLTNAVRETCRYSRRTDPGTQRPAVTLEKASGTCRDFTLLMMEAARILGFAARFVTGYIYVPAREKGTIRGGGATHAWVQIFLPGAGWVEFDPTNGIVGNEDLIRVGVARDPSQARPLSGSYAGPAGSYLGMEVDVLVNKLNDDVAASGPGAVVSFRG
ncbi:MAG: transglutaminase family protein [Devosia sp.]